MKAAAAASGRRSTGKAVSAGEIEAMLRSKYPNAGIGGGGAAEYRARSIPETRASRLLTGMTDAERRAARVASARARAAGTVAAGEDVIAAGGSRIAGLLPGAQGKIRFLRRLVSGGKGAVASRVLGAVGAAATVLDIGSGIYDMVTEKQRTAGAKQEFLEQLGNMSVAESDRYNEEEWQKQMDTLTASTARRASADEAFKVSQALEMQRLLTDNTDVLAQSSVQSAPTVAEIYARLGV